MHAIASMLCTGVLLAANAVAQTPPAPAAAPAPASAAAPAAAPAMPGLKITTLDGKDWDLAAQRGHWVVVNFWATWCSPCLKEIPDLAALDAKRDDLEVIGLAYEEITPADMQAFLKEHPAGYPIAILDVYDPPKDFDTPRGLPMTYLIGPDGTVAQRFLGPVTAQELEQAIAAHSPPAA
jgi:thiol-disulfide isomerase/thioredoxin